MNDKYDSGMTHHCCISRRSFVKISTSASLAALAGVMASCANRAAPTDRIRLAYFPNLTHAAALVGMQTGAFAKAAAAAGSTLDAKTFNAGPALIEALLAGEIDIGYVGPSPAINGYVRSNGKALKIIAGASSGGALFVVRPGANIAAAQDLAGKKIATPQRGGTQDIALRHYARANGLKTSDEGGDLTIVPTANPDILTLFKQEQIDGAWVPEPWGTRLLQEANGTLLFDERSIWPDGKFITTLIVVSTKFLEAQPALVRGIVEAHLGALEMIRANPDEARSLANKEIERITTKALPAKVIEAAFANVDFTHEPLESSLFTQADYAFELGFLGKDKPDLKDIYDLRILNEALR
jgi:NitT/TauT family transport system substrate-binding protein